MSVSAGVPIAIADRRPTRYVAVPRLTRADIAGQPLDTIALPPTIAGAVAYNDAYDTKRQASIDVRRPDQLRKLRDYVLVDLDITDDTGRMLTISLGHYVVTGHDIAMGNTGRAGTVHLRDLTWLLHIEAMPSDWVTLAGTDLGRAMRDVLTSRGIPPGRYVIPDAGAVATVDIRPAPGETVLAYLTVLAQAWAAYQPWTIGAGPITTMRQRDIRAAIPDASYHTADGAKIVPPVKEPLADITALYNRVTVVKQGVGDDPGIEETVTVTDESSPVHPDRLAETIGRPDVPFVRTRRIDAYDIADAAVARALAEATLSEGASMYQPLTIQTYPDHTLEGHQILDLDLINPEDGASHYTGAWWQREWRIDLRRTTATVTRDLFRTERWQ